MLTLDQWAIILCSWVGCAIMTAGWLLATGDRSVQARHRADPDLLRAVPGPRRPDYAAAAAPIEFPAPRPFTGGIPVLVVDGPPSTRGSLPAPGLPYDVRPSCSLCRDGQVVLAGTGACPWCGQTKVATTS